MRVSPDDTAVREKYKRIVAKEFTPSWTRGPRLSVARKAVQDYRKVASSAEGMYRDAVDHVVKHGLQDQFRERSRRFTRYDLGYGLSDALMDYHAAGFGDDLENAADDDG